MFALFLTPEAEDDIQAILQYTYEQWGKQQAHIYIEKLDDAFSRLQEHPQLGVRKDHYFVGCHCLLVEQHALYYRLNVSEIEKGQLEVIRVLHKSRDANRIFS